MRLNKMAKYQQVIREQLERMNPDELMAQYHSLIDVFKETRGIPFERNPQTPREELIRLIEAGQRNYLKGEITERNILDSLDVLADQLVEWGERTGMSDKPILVSGGQTQ